MSITFTQPTMRTVFDTLATIVLPDLHFQPIGTRAATRTATRTAARRERR